VRGEARYPVREDESESGNLFWIREKERVEKALIAVWLLLFHPITGNRGTIPAVR
jgi:hypothetical protein